MVRPYCFAQTDAARKLPAHLRNGVDDIARKVSNMILYLAKKLNINSCFEDLSFCSKEQEQRLAVGIRRTPRPVTQGIANCCGLFDVYNKFVDIFDG